MFDLPRRGFLGSLIASVVGVFGRSNPRVVIGSGSSATVLIRPGSIYKSAAQVAKPFNDYNGRMVTCRMLRGVGVVIGGRIYADDNEIYLFVAPRYGDYNGLTARGFSGVSVKVSECFTHHEA